MRAQHPSRRPALLDPGWLFLIAGLALLIATVLIPAYTDLAEARHRRDTALAVESRALDRMQRHAEYLEALRRGDERLALSLAARHLSMIPEGRQIVPVPGETLTGDLNPFSELEPPPLDPPSLNLPDSLLQRWTTDDRARLWLLALGAISVLVGLLPPSVPTRPRRKPAD